MVFDGNQWLNTRINCSPPVGSEVSESPFIANAALTAACLAFRCAQMRGHGDRVERSPSCPLIVVSLEFVKKDTLPVWLYSAQKACAARPARGKKARNLRKARPVIEAGNPADGPMYSSVCSAHSVYFFSP